MKNEYMVAVIIGVVLLSISYAIAPQSHHYSMMVSPFYGFVPSLLALTGILLIVAPLLFSIQSEKREEKPIKQTPENRSVANNETDSEGKINGEKITVAEKLLDEDERKIFGIVVKNEGITQDSLHFRTGFSHSKISMIIKKLEEKDLIYRERFGKTYRIYVSDWIKE